MVTLGDKGKEKACDSAWGLSVTLSPLLWPTWECINLNFVCARTRYLSVLLSTFLPRWWNLCSRTVAKVKPNSLVCQCQLPKPCYYFKLEAWRPQVVTLWMIASLASGMWQLLWKVAGCSREVIPWTMCYFSCLCETGAQKGRSNRTWLLDMWRADRKTLLTLSKWRNDCYLMASSNLNSSFTWQGAEF